jgi:DNA-binding response OmpR family regulator
VDSTVGMGTTFRILLPAGAPEPLVAEAASPAQRGTEGRVVLVIDDEDYMLEVVRDSLEAHGHAALLAQSGEEGVELLRRHRDRVDLVLLDLTMPGLGGVETCRRLQEVEPAVPVILSSGFAEEEAMIRLRGMNLAGFLQKPYLVMDLVRVVESTPCRAKGGPEPD